MSSQSKNGTGKRVSASYVTMPHARAVVISVFLLIGLSLWRKLVRLDHMPWQVSHGIPGEIVVILAMIHIILVGFYNNAPLKDVLWTAYGAFWVLLLFYVHLSTYLAIAIGIVIVLLALAFALL